MIRLGRPTRTTCQTFLVGADGLASPPGKGPISSPRRLRPTSSPTPRRGGLATRLTALSRRRVPLPLDAPTAAIRVLARLVTGRLPTLTVGPSFGLQPSLGRSAFRRATTIIGTTVARRRFSVTGAPTLVVAPFALFRTGPRAHTGAGRPSLGEVQATRLGHGVGTTQRLGGRTQGLPPRATPTRTAPTPTSAAMVTAATLAPLAAPCRATSPTPTTPTPRTPTFLVAPQDPCSALGRVRAGRGPGTAAPTPTSRPDAAKIPALQVAH